MAELPHDIELLDLVDINDHVVGSILHSQVFDPSNLGGRYLRAVNAFIINGKGKLLIFRRTHDKKIAPDGLDFSVGEHVMQGESYDTAIVRGFEEELNMDIDINDLEQFSILPPQANKPPYFNVNYLYKSDEVPQYNPLDFVGFEWLEPQELIDRLKSGDKGKITLIDTAKSLLEYQSLKGSKSATS